MGRKAKQNYWQQEQEQLVIDYINEVSPDKRSAIYNQLRPELRKMIEGVAGKYYSSFLSVLPDDERENIYSDSESFLIEKTIMRFQPEKNTKAYSFLGTSIKNYLHSFFISKKALDRSVKISLSNHNDDGELVFDLQSDEEKIIDNSELIIEATDFLLSKRKQATNIQREIIDAFVELFELGNWNNYYAQYFLMKKTGLPVNGLNQHFMKMGITSFISKRRDVMQKINDIVELSTTEEQIKNRLLELDDDCISNFIEHPIKKKRSYTSRKEYYQINKKRIIENVKLYYQANKKKIAEYEKANSKKIYAQRKEREAKQKEERQKEKNKTVSSMAE